MKQKRAFISVLLFIATILLGNYLNAETIFDNKEHIIVYFPYNYSIHSNKTSWNNSSYTGIGKENNIQRLGIGIKYFPKKWLYFDFSFKTLLSQVVIADENIISNNTKINPFVEDLNSYSLVINYNYVLKNSINIFAGFGKALNKIFIKENELIFLATNVSTYFETWIFHIGVNYKITDRCAFSFAIGYETNANLVYVNKYGTRLLFNYSSPYFIEPAINFYF